MSVEPDAVTYEFGSFRLEPGERLLLREGVPVTLTPKAFDLLVYLVERHGRLCEKQAILSAVWAETVVEEVNLASNISALRKVLDDRSSGASMIQTVPTKGYRFVASVSFDSRATASLESTIASATPPAGRHRLHWVVWTAAALGAIGLEVLAGTRDAPPAASLPAPTRALAATSPAPRGPLVAVLPFRNLTSDASQQYLADGLSEEIHGQLSRLTRLRLLSAAAARKYGDTGATKMATDLGLTNYIEGSVRRERDHVRITVSLIEARTQQTAWSEQYERTAAGILDVETDVARRIIEALRLTLSPLERNRLSTRPTTNTEALTRAFVSGARDYGFLEPDPIFAPLRSDPSFRALIGRMKTDVAAQRARARARGLLDMAALETAH